MPLGADNMQASQFHDALVILFALMNLLLEEFALLLLGHILDVLLNRPFFLCAFILSALWHLANVADVLGVFPQDTVEVARRVATQQDVSTATGHVCGDGDCAAASGLCNNLCLTLVVLCVEHIVCCPLPIEQLREIF